VLADPGTGMYENDRLRDSAANRNYERQTGIFAASPAMRGEAHRFPTLDKMHFYNNKTNVTLTLTGLRRHRPNEHAPIS
jgi:hypothetical protein